MAGIVAVFNAEYVQPHVINEFVSRCDKLVAAYSEPPSGIAFSELNLKDLFRFHGKWVIMCVDDEWVCTHLERVVGGHALASISFCIHGSLPREAVFTASPPLTLRRSKRAILNSYITRLLDEGASFERIAAKLVAKLGVDAVAVVAVILEPRKVPVALMAGKRLCIVHYDGAAGGATTFLPKCTIVEDSVVTLKFIEGVPRVEVRDAGRLAR